MLILLPPSETKRDGGAARPLRIESLAYPALSEQRSTALETLIALAGDQEAAMAALKLGRTQTAEVERNRRLLDAPLMPAIDRYTGVLYDALDAATLAPTEREFADRHLIIHSALFGPVRALDEIPAYRLSHDSRLPGMTLRRHWSEAVSAAIAETSGLVIDLRSEAYAKLGPAPEGSVYLRVVADSAGGRRSALNHFNKKAKGEFTRALLQAGIAHRDEDSLLGWAPAAGFRLEHGARGELDLVV